MNACSCPVQFRKLCIETKTKTFDCINSIWYPLQNCGSFVKFVMFGCVGGMVWGDYFFRVCYWVGNGNGCVCSGRLSSQGYDLLCKLLSYDPNKRISMKEALQHPWFTESPKPTPIVMMPTLPTPQNAGRGFMIR
eukprot:TRINITY_DN8297_c0_g1_i2.p1 TRINITY_DN8297_c0_g1~~TRINITY_DN8297_c0_g1_i2.p1  ORF type:complete len:135 (+),score=3.35 TRINITY_DN8297_c0_g1_i2:3-407(+)